MSSRVCSARPWPQRLLFTCLNNFAASRRCILCKCWSRRTLFKYLRPVLVHPHPFLSGLTLSRRGVEVAEEPCDGAVAAILRLCVTWPTRRFGGPTRKTMGRRTGRQRGAGIEMILLVCIPLQRWRGLWIYSNWEDLNETTTAIWKSRPQRQFLKSWFYDMHLLSSSVYW